MLEEQQVNILYYLHAQHLDGEARVPVVAAVTVNDP